MNTTTTISATQHASNQSHLIFILFIMTIVLACVGLFLVLIDQQDDKDVLPF